MKSCIIFAPIAEREIHFYLAFAEHAKASNLPYEIQFISFFQSGNELLKQKGYKVWDIYEWVEKTDRFVVPEKDLEKYFEIVNIHRLTLHEKLTFGVGENRKLYDKFYKYLNATKLILDEILKNFSADRINVFQELGGFVAPLSLMYSSKKAGINHIFFEPSFFKGTMSFVENSYVSSFKGLSMITEPSSPEAIKHLDDARAKKSLVIPQKDQHHYKDMGLLKLFNVYNLKKLFDKLYIKYVKKQRQEYEWISNHVFRNVKQYFNRIKTGQLYSDKVPQEEFIYFPFHVRLDFQLTIRNPEFLDQLSFVEYVAQVLPKRYKLVVKEHPASIGGFDPNRLKHVMNSYENVTLLKPMINTYEILDKAAAVITINSKVGAEAASLGQNVACMGHGFYWNSEIVDKLSSTVELREWLEKLARNEVLPRTQPDINKYFSELYRNSYPFELYNHDPKNMNNFFNSIEKYLNRK